MPGGVINHSLNSLKMSSRGGGIVLISGSASEIFRILKHAVKNDWWLATAVALAFMIFYFSFVLFCFFSRKLCAREVWVGSHIPPTSATGCALTSYQKNAGTAFSRVIHAVTVSLRRGVRLTSIFVVYRIPCCYLQTQSACNLPDFPPGSGSVAFLFCRISSLLSFFIVDRSFGRRFLLLLSHLSANFASLSIRDVRLLSFLRYCTTKSVNVVADMWWFQTTGCLILILPPAILGPLWTIIKAMLTLQSQVAQILFFFPKSDPDFFFFFLMCEQHKSHQIQSFQIRSGSLKCVVPNSYPSFTSTVACLRRKIT